MARSTRAEAGAVSTSRTLTDTCWKSCQCPRRVARRNSSKPSRACSVPSPGRLLLVLPLSVGQAPATAECLVQANMGEETVAANLRERVLRRVELLLGFEHLEVIGQPLAIAIRRMLDGLLERLDGRVLSRLGLVQLAQRGEGVRDFAEGAEHRLLVLKPCLLPLCDGRA